MRTRAALVNIQALSAELLASAACCSTRASLEFRSVAEPGAAAAFWAHTTGTKVKNNRTVARRAIVTPAITRHFNLVPFPGFEDQLQSKTASLYPPRRFRGNRNYLSWLSGFVIENGGKFGCASRSHCGDAAGPLETRTGGPSGVAEPAWLMQSSQKKMNALESESRLGASGPALFAPPRAWRTSRHRPERSSSLRSLGL